MQDGIARRSSGSSLPLFHKHPQLLARLDPMSLSLLPVVGLLLSQPNSNQGGSPTLKGSLSYSFLPALALSVLIIVLGTGVVGE